MNLRRNLGVPAFALALSLAFAGNALASQAPVPLADAAPFGALSKTAMTNVGLDTVVNGDIGSSGAIGIGVTHPAFAECQPRGTVRRCSSAREAIEETMEQWAVPTPEPAGAAHDEG